MGTAKRLAHSSTYYWVHSTTYQWCVRILFTISCSGSNERPLAMLRAGDGDFLRNLKGEECFLGVASGTLSSSSSKLYMSFCSSVFRSM